MEIIRPSNGDGSEKEARSPRYAAEQENLDRLLHPSHGDRWKTTAQIATFRYGVKIEGKR
jgi:hypothetical protein